MYALLCYQEGSLVSTTTLDSHPECGVCEQIAAERIDEPTDEQWADIRDEVERYCFTTADEQAVVWIHYENQGWADD